MIRRRDADVPTGDEVEILDAARSSSESLDTATVEHSRGNALAVLVALVAAGLGIAALANSGSDAAAPPTTPTTSAPPNTQPANDIERPLAATIGAGPTLVWESIDDDSDATSFEWVDGRFFGSGGTTDTFIEPLPGTAANVTAIEAEDLTAQNINSSSEVISPIGDPSVLIYPDAGRISLPSVADPMSDLVTPVTDVTAERLGDQVLVLQSTITVLDLDQFRARVETDMDPIFEVSIDQVELTIRGSDRTEVVPVADLELSVEDRSAIQDLGQVRQVLSIGTIDTQTEPIRSPMSRIDWISVTGEEFVAGGDQLWRSSNGIDWEQSTGDTPRFGGLNQPGPDGILSGLAFEGDAGFLTLSTDAGRSWDRLPRPFENTWTIDSTFPVLAMTGWQDDPSVRRRSDWVVLSPRFELRISGEEETFELLDREGDEILSGRTGDPASGFRFFPGSLDIWFVDPATGEEIARFPQSVFASSFAAARTLEGSPQLVAFADVMESDGVTLEWSLSRVTELFGPEALAVDFTPGHGWLLADVTTTTGRELYLAEIEQAVLRPLSERRHPTYAELSGQQPNGD